MASLFCKGTNDPYYFLKYKDPATGSWRMRSTKLRWDDRNEANQAKQLCALTTAEELRNGSVGDGEHWGAWVQDFLDLHYPKTSKTHIRYQSCWNILLVYLTQKEIFSPRRLTHALVKDYFPWRAQHKVLRTGANKNTALYEIRVLKLIMGEAIKRFDLQSKNPCLELGIKKDPVKIKPEFTKADIKTIRANLKTRPEWMSVAFEIAIHQGCRLMETCLPLSRINTDGKRIQFHAKGGKIFTTQLHPKLIPLIKRLKAEGKTYTWDASVNSQPSTEWTRFFRKIGLPQYCFHCCRVSVISALARCKNPIVPEREAMLFVGHSSVEVHRIYQRLNDEDVSSCLKALKF